CSIGPEETCEGGPGRPGDPSRPRRRLREGDVDLFHRRGARTAPVPRVRHPRPRAAFLLRGGRLPPPPRPPSESRGAGKRAGGTRRRTTPCAVRPETPSVDARARPADGRPPDRRVVHERLRSGAG